MKTGLRKEDDRMAKTSMLAVSITAFAFLMLGSIAASGGETPMEPEQKAQPSEAAPSSGEQVAIKVHGHWTIEVRNPDGTLAEHREFENAYVGGTFLPRILARQAQISTSSFWSVTLRGGSAPNYIFFANIAELNGGGLSPPLVPATGPNTGKFVLSGNRTNTSNDTWSVNAVLTAFSSIGTFTEATLSQAITISPGQQVAVTVVISFS